jgi:glycosyltransferase involved in cell wall biosynthesis
VEFVTTKISIVTPSFNSAKFIEDCIQSVLNQNYPNFEHIIIDGGSTDGTIDILTKYPHLNWISENDKGQSDALNKGFKMASGDLIGWLNADDYYINGTFKLVRTYFLSNPKIDVLYGNCQFVDENKNFISKSKTISINKFLLVNRFYIPSTSTFMKKNIFDQNEFINTSLHYVMDKEFFLRLVYKNKTFKRIPNVLASFRWHDANKSLKSGFNTKRSIESIKVNRMYFQKYLPKPFTNLNIKINYYISSLIFHLIYFTQKIKSKD